MTDTPRTDALEFSEWEGAPSTDDTHQKCVLSSFARQLERELAAMTADRDAHKAASAPRQFTERSDGKLDADVGGSSI
jgi:hypothetical protein